MKVTINDEVILYKLKSGHFITQDTVFRMLGFSETNYRNIMNDYRTSRHLKRHNYQEFQLIHIPSRGGFHYERMISLDCFRTLAEYLKETYKCVKATQALKVVFQGVTEN